LILGFLERSAPVAVHRSGSMIEVKGLGKDYGGFVAVRDLSFNIPQGQVVALLGPNGAGKTTMIRILTGYLAASRGTARIAGLDVCSDRLKVSRRLGYLPENGPLYSDMTPLALLWFFGEARGLSTDCIASAIQRVVEECELQEIIEKPIGKLSKGLRQRVGLAQALLHDPDVLIMDEPTAGLDPNQIRRFRSEMQRLRRRKTLLISTHILQEVDAVAERILLIHAGRLVFDGSPEAMRENGSLEEPFSRLTQPC
jgi:ABC-2 type transport system ATP-binding protein